MAERARAELDRAADAGFEDLVRSHYQAMVRFFRRRGLGREDAGDLTQETFVRIYEGLDDFRAEARFETWMYRVATNVLLKHLRHRSALKRRMERDAASLDAASETSQSIEVPSQVPDPLAAALGNETAARLSAAIDALPPRMRACLQLRLEQNLDVRSIAGVLGMAPQTVKAHLFQARRRLRQVLEAADDPQESYR